MPQHYDDGDIKEYDMEGICYAAPCIMACINPHQVLGQQQQRKLSTPADEEGLWDATINHIIDEEVVHILVNPVL